MKKVTVETLSDSLIKKINIFEEKEFETKKEANKFKREMIKKYNLIKHAGHIVNYSDRYELFTNY